MDRCVLVRNAFDDRQDRCKVLYVRGVRVDGGCKGLRLVSTLLDDMRQIRTGYNEITEVYIPFACCG